MEEIRKAVKEYKDSIQEIKYDDFLAIVQTGDVFATANKNWFSSLIRVFTQSKISHVGVFIWLEDRLFIAEALEPQGVILTLASQRFRPSKEKTFIGKAYKELDEQKTKERAFEHLGKKYDLFGALTALIKKNSHKKLFCSEYAKYVLDLNYPMTTRGITPDDIMKKVIGIKELVF